MDLLFEQNVPSFQTTYKRAIALYYSKQEKGDRCQLTSVKKSDRLFYQIYSI
ncbi:hypothetical protein [Nostoc sp.]|uniref:hypothetical protein n=1 Tax=Nostoc sp. TaxID=1180 RepID=UPI002FF62389